MRSNAKIVSLLFVGLLTSLMCLANTLPLAHAAPLQTNSKIVTSELFPDGYHLVSINPDGTDPTMLGQGNSPAISPDGTKIAYQNFVNESSTDFCNVTYGVTNKFDLFVMNADGSNVQDLTPSQSCSNNSHPSWSPDGSKITYASQAPTDLSDSGGVIWGPGYVSIINVEDRSVTSLGVTGASPYWSPDGTRILYTVGTPLFPDSSSTVSMINVDGSNQVSLATGGAKGWSPDGSKILFVDPSGNFYTIHPDGTGKTFLFADQWVAFDFAWSPDSSSLAFTTAIIPTPENKVYTIPATGGIATPIYTSPTDGRLFGISWGYLRTGNAAPLVNPLAAGASDEGATFSESGSFSDPDSTSWAASVDYGDGSGSHPLTLNSDNTFTLSHVYQDNGVYTVTFTVTDNQGAIGTGTTTVTVDNVPPTIGTISLTPNPLLSNTTITASASFTDPGVLDTHTAVWDWGDGTSTSGVVTESNGSGVVSGSHVYSIPGVYAVTVAVTDKDGGQTTQTFQYVSVYSPTAQGLFAAGQRFSSPAGAYALNPGVTGNVSFGLAYKYQGTMPTGNRQFTMNFGAANLLFNAISVSALVISGNQAILMGTGTINGAGSYNYTVVGLDGGAIRIQIVDPTTGAVIYDTQSGAPLTAAPTTPVNGHVAVH